MSSFIKVNELIGVHGYSTERLVHLLELGRLTLEASMEHARSLIYQQSEELKVGLGIASGKTRIKLDLKDAKHILKKSRLNIVHARLIDATFEKWDFNLPNGQTTPFHGISQWNPREITSPFVVPTFVFFEPRLGKEHQGESPLIC